MIGWEGFCKYEKLHLCPAERRAFVVMGDTSKGAFLFCRNMHSVALLEELCVSEVEQQGAMVRVLDSSCIRNEVASY